MTRLTASRVKREGSKSHLIRRDVYSLTQDFYYRYKKCIEIRLIRRRMSELERNTEFRFYF